MRMFLRCLALALSLAPISAATLRADDLNVHLQETCLSDDVCNSWPTSGGPGTPAIGNADFNHIQQPWNIVFQTGNPIEWQCFGQQYCDGYSATFGSGGFITINGPNGLTFSGQITSGVGGYFLDEGESVSVNYAGYWSNKQYGYGDLTIGFSQEGPYTATFDAYTAVPEPATLAMFASGLAVMFGICRRRLKD
jgi:hypothetical protein